MPYHHLSLDERTCIAGLIWQGHSIRAIATMLDRHPSTISREIRRNRSPKRQEYHPVATHRRAQSRSQWVRKRPKSNDPGLISLVKEKILAGWSPEQISGRLRRQYPGIPGQWVSHQTIYHMVAERPELHKGLRRGGRKPKKRSGPQADKRGHMLGCKRISDRPEVVRQRLRVGDWEGDSMISRKSKAVVLAFLERGTGFFVARKKPDHSSEAMLWAAREAFWLMPQTLLRTLTLDNGKENACHRQLEQEHGLSVYFADPGRPWQRGRCENVLGLLRQYIPKRPDIAKVSSEQLQEYVDALNNRPRKRLNYRTPSEAFQDAIVALDS